MAATLAAHPSVLVLDEPTSALDPTGAEDVLAAVSRLVHDLGTTVLLAEHRLERIVQHTDTAVWMPGGGHASYGSVSAIVSGASMAPPVVELGRMAGWTPAPLSVRDARRLAGPLRSALAASRPDGPATVVANRGPAVLSARGVVVRHGTTDAVRGVDLDLFAGEVVALMGRNGSGKSSLLWALQGSGARAAGRVQVGGHDPGRVSAPEGRRLVGLVPQTAADLLWLTTVGEEMAEADAESGAARGTARGLLERLMPGLDQARHPRDLSEGQRLAVALAVQLTAAPPVVLLDEPTRGLDHGAKARFAAAIQDLAQEGRAVVMATHDVELVATAADRVVVMAEGEVVADGPTAEVVVSSPTFAPQVAKVLHPDPWLTVAQVADALAASGPGPRP